MYGQCKANQKKYLVSGIPTVSLNCRSVGRRTMTRPRPSFLRRYSLNWRCKKKGVAATSHLKTTPLFFFFFFFFLPFLKKVGRSGYRKQDISSGWPNTMQHFQALGNTKLPLRSASCYCGLSCVVPSPPSCPSASHGLLP